MRGGGDRLEKNVFGWGFRRSAGRFVCGFDAIGRRAFLGQRHTRIGLGVDHIGGICVIQRDRVVNADKRIAGSLQIGH